VSTWYDYSIAPGKKYITHVRNVGCFAGIYGRDEVNLKVYIPYYLEGIDPPRGDYKNPIWGLSKNPMSPAEVTKHAEMLHKMGFVFEYVEDGEMKGAYTSRDEVYSRVKNDYVEPPKGPFPAHIFTIDSGANTHFALMWLLNSLRQTYETPNQTVVQLMQKHVTGAESRLELLNKFLILHHAVGGTGQNVVPYSEGTFLPMSEEFMHKAFEDKAWLPGRCDTALPSNSVYRSEVPLYNLLQQGVTVPWKQITEEYEKAIAAVPPPKHPVFYRTVGGSFGS